MTSDEEARNHLDLAIGYALLALLEVTTHRGDERELELQVARKYRDLLRQELTVFEKRAKS